MPPRATRRFPPVLRWREATGREKGFKCYVLKNRVRPSCEYSTSGAAARAGVPGCAFDHLSHCFRLCHEDGVTGFHLDRLCTASFGHLVQHSIIEGFVVSGDDGPTRFVPPGRVLELR